METIKVICLADNNGKELVKVPVKNTDRSAILYKADFDELIAIGLNPRWSIYQNKIVAVLPKVRRYGYIDRVMMNAKGGQIVRHINRDPFDLRRNNLFISSGHSTLHDRSYVDPAHVLKPTRPIIEIIHSDDKLEQAKTSSEPGSIMPWHT